MKALRVNFRKNGFDYKQIKATAEGYIYQLTSGNTTRYEVFKHKINTRFNVVSYPGNEAFGSWAWSCITLDYAEFKLKTFKSKSNG